METASQGFPTRQNKHWGCLAAPAALQELIVFKMVGRSWRVWCRLFHFLGSTTWGLLGEACCTVPCTQGRDDTEPQETPALKVSAM